MRGKLVARQRLDESTRGEMLELMRRHFAGVDPGRFRKDLEAKNWVVLIQDERGRLQGFSTLLFYVARFDRETFTVVYSGDTIMDPTCWNSSAMSRTWIDSVRRLYRTAGEGRLLWLLLTAGFRTYRLLPVFWREFSPRYDRATPVSTQRLMHRLATDLFGDAYDRRAGAVRFGEHYVLRPEFAGVPPAKLSDAHVAFFLRSNPGYTNGDELVCLTELSDANLTRAGRRMVRAGECRREDRAVVR